MQLESKKVSPKYGISTDIYTSMKFLIRKVKSFKGTFSNIYIKKI